MADLVPIKSFASSKGSKSAQTKPASRSQPATVERFAAIDYVRNLTTAPDGSRIASTEKNVLLHIALAFNATVGIAWPSVKTLAGQACVSVRHCRRTLKSLERKKVIQRVPMRRDGDGRQTSNEYFFPALGSPSQTPEAKARRLEIQKVSRTPMTRATGVRGQRRPAEADPSVRPTRTNATGGPGHGRPPIESLGDCSTELQSDSLRDSPAVRSRAAKVEPTECPKAFPTRTKTPFALLSLARTAWDSAIEEVRSSKGAGEIRKFRFRDVTVTSADQDGSGTVHLTLRSPAPDKAAAGIKTSGIALENALRSFYGCDVKLRVIGHEKASAPANNRPKHE